MTLSELKDQCLSCDKCDLCLGRTNMVFGVGNEKAKIMFVGEGPGEQEDKQGEPFVGKSGKLLDHYLNVIGLSRDKNIYIANIVKCRPPENRDPSEDEQHACIKWLREQFKIIRPQIVVCLGRIASQVIIEENFKVTKDHGKFYDKKGIYMMGTYHPSALLRNSENKECALMDFLALRDKIEELSLEI